MSVCLRCVCVHVCLSPGRGEHSTLRGSTCLCVCVCMSVCLRCVCMCMSVCLRCMCACLFEGFIDRRLRILK